MENDLTNSTVLNGIKEDSGFLGNVPKTVEVSAVSICLGAPILYNKDKITGLTNVCMLHPNKPTVVTLGNEDSFGVLSYDGTYHQLGLDNLIVKDSTTTISNEVAYKSLFNKFQNTFNLGMGNGYSEILEKKFYDLGENIKISYPNSFRTFETFANNYLAYFKANYSEKSSENVSKVAFENTSENATENLGEKKTIIPQEMVQQASNANA